METFKIDVLYNDLAGRPEAIFRINWYLTHPSETGSGDFTEETKRLISMIKPIGGVKSVEVKPQELIVIGIEKVEWKAVVPAIEAAFREVFERRLEFRL